MKRLFISLLVAFVVQNCTASEVELAGVKAPSTMTSPATSVNQRLLITVEKGARSSKSTSFDLALLPTVLQDLFVGTGPIEPARVDALERALLEQMPEETELIERTLSKTRSYLEQGRWLAARARIRALAVKCRASNLAEDVIEDNQSVYESKASGYEIPLPCSALTMKLGWPESEIYLFGSKHYQPGGLLEGHEPILADSRGLIGSAAVAGSAVCPLVAGYVSGLATGVGVDRMTRTMSAPVFARYYAYSKHGLSEKEFNERFEEQVVKDYRIPGTEAAYRTTYHLRDKRTGKEYKASFDALDVLAVATTVTHAVSGLKGSSQAVATIDDNAAALNSDDVVTASTIDEGVQSISATGRVRPHNGRINVGGGFEAGSHGASNLQPFMDQCGGPAPGTPVPHLVEGKFSQISKLFQSNSAETIYSCRLPYSTVNWKEAAKGAYEVLRRGGKVELNVWTMTVDEVNTLIRVFREAGFSQVTNVTGTTGTATIISAVKPL